MAQDIIPIRLSLTAGDLTTLWAPRWRQDGEEWEAFLGDDDALFAFADAADLAAWIEAAERAGTAHDLADHPAWSVVGGLSVDELTPDDVQHYDLVGAPELVAGDPDQWTVDELAEVVAMCRSLADVCDLAAVTEVLDSSRAFAALGQGETAFGGRRGRKLWAELSETVIARWDEVVDAVDTLITVPAVDADRAERLRATATARGGDLDPVSSVDDDGAPAAPAEDAENHPADPAAVAQDPQDVAAPDAPPHTLADTAGASLRTDLVDADEAPAPGFWEEIGIDPIRITTSDSEVVTLRCYVDDEPVFLGRRGTVYAFASERELRSWIAGAGGSDDAAGEHDLAAVATWDEVITRATAGELDVVVDPENHYVLVGIAEDLAEGPDVVDAAQLELAVELITDAARWAGDTATGAALAPSESLGWLVSFIVRPDPTRLTPSPPFQREAMAWRTVEDRFLGRLGRP